MKNRFFKKITILLMLLFVSIITYSQKYNIMEYDNYKYPTIKEEGIILGKLKRKDNVIKYRDIWHRRYKIKLYKYVGVKYDEIFEDSVLVYKARVSNVIRIKENSYYVSILDKGDILKFIVYPLGINNITFLYLHCTLIKK